MFHNIEKSTFRRGEYVGYSCGEVFEIRRTNSSYGNWCATVNVAKFPGTKFANRHIFASTLAKLSDKLGDMNFLVNP